MIAKNSEVTITGKSPYYTARQMSYVYHVQDIRLSKRYEPIPMVFVMPKRTIKTGKVATMSVASKGCMWVPVSDLSELVTGDPVVSEGTMSAYDRWLDTFIDERELDLDARFEVASPKGVMHSFSYGVIIEHIKITSRDEQEAIRRMIVKIDFHDGDIYHYLRHLGQALANMAD